MSEIYSYKKTIETDLTKDDIYHRLTYVLLNKLKIESFYIFETNLLKDERRIVFATDDIKDQIPHCTTFKNIKSACRAERTNTIVFSDNFPDICRVSRCEEESLFSCIPFLVNEQIHIVIHVVCKDKESMQQLKHQIGIIKKYLEETKPILESKILMEALREKNLTDELTKLYNRRYLDEFIEKELPTHIDNNTKFAVMFLDIDYFKLVNDTHGHDVGDRILKRLADVMKSVISEDDFIVRFGGEEFLIIMKNAEEESALALAQKINQEFGNIVFTYNGQSFRKTISIGYSLFPDDTNQIWKCIKYADMSLYEAKNTGRNKIVRFTKELLKNGDNSKNSDDKGCC
jgi:diguanylate cyclase (GGDEF)-like protein